MKNQKPQPAAAANQEAKPARYGSRSHLLKLLEDERRRFDEMNVRLTRVHDELAQVKTERQELALKVNSLTKRHEGLRSAVLEYALCTQNRHTETNPDRLATLQAAIAQHSMEHRMDFPSIGRCPGDS